MALPERIDFTKYVGATTTFSEFVLTERGFVNIYKPVGGASLTTFTPMGGEDRFSAFMVAGSADPSQMADRPPDADDDGTSTGLRIYVAQEQSGIGFDPIRVVTPHDGSVSTAMTPAAAFNNIQGINLGRGDSPYGFFTANEVPLTSTTLRRWVRADEPSTSSAVLTSLNYNTEGVYDYSAVADNGNVWLSGYLYDSGFDSYGLLRLVDANGTVLLDLTFEDGSSLHGYTRLGDPHAIGAMGGVAAVGDDALVLSTNTGVSPAEPVMFHASQAGVVTDITDRVFIEGTPWVDNAPVDNLGWSLGRRGDRIITRTVPTLGSSFAYLGVVIFPAVVPSPRPNPGPSSVRYYRYDRRTPRTADAMMAPGATRPPAIPTPQ